MENHKLVLLVKNKMLELGLNRVELAKKMGITEGTIRKWERDGFDNAKLTNIKKLCKVLNINPLLFIGGESVNISMSYDDFIKIKNELNKK